MAQVPEDYAMLYRGDFGIKWEPYTIPVGEDIVLVVFESNKYCNAVDAAVDHIDWVNNDGGWKIMYGSSDDICALLKRSRGYCGELTINPPLSLKGGSAEGVHVLDVDRYIEAH